MQSKFVLSSPSLGRVMEWPTPFTKRVIKGPDKETGASGGRWSQSHPHLWSPTPWRSTRSESQFAWLGTA